MPPSLTCRDLLKHRLYLLYGPPKYWLRSRRKQSCPHFSGGSSNVLSLSRPEMVIRFKNQAPCNPKAAPAPGYHRHRQNLWNSVGQGVGLPSAKGPLQGPLQLSVYMSSLLHFGLKYEKKKNAGHVHSRRRCTHHSHPKVSTWSTPCWYPYQSNSHMMQFWPESWVGNQDNWKWICKNLNSFCLNLIIILEWLP